MAHKIGFLGFGSMAQAICRGALQKGAISETSVYFSQRNAKTGTKTASELGITFCSSEDLVNSVDILFLGVKPQQLNDALDSLALLPSSLTIVSLLAGTSLETLAKHCESGTGIVRTMPNTPALINQGVTAICKNDTVNSDALNTIQSLFDSVGSIQFVEESHMDIVTALSGSGPAFVYALARDMVQEGVSQGLSENSALQLVSETLIGAAKMLQTQSKPPNELISDVASPGGTTEAGLNAYSEQDITHKIRTVIKAASDRSKALRNKKES